SLTRPTHCSSFFSYSPGPSRALHSFPTRRSSDLGWRIAAELGRRVRAPARRIQVAAAEDELDGDAPLLGLVQRVVTEALELVLRSEEHTSELQSLTNLVCRLLLEKKKTQRHALST